MHADVPGSPRQIECRGNQSPASPLAAPALRSATPPPRRRVRHASFARPGGNMTGFTIFPTTITGKYLSMLKEMVPQLARVAILYSADYTRSFFLPPLVGAARELKVQPITALSAQPRRD